MKKKATNHEILKKIVDKLNEKGFTKDTLKDVTKEDVKPVLREVFEEYLSFGGIEKSPKESWKNACLEIIQEYQAANDGKMGNINGDINGDVDDKNIDEKEIEKDYSDDDD